MFMTFLIIIYRILVIFYKILIIINKILIIIYKILINNRIKNKFVNQIYYNNKKLI